MLKTTNAKRKHLAVDTYQGVRDKVIDRSPAISILLRCCCNHELWRVGGLTAGEADGCGVRRSQSETIGPITVDEHRDVELGPGRARRDRTRRTDCRSESWRVRKIDCPFTPAVITHPMNAIAHAR